VSLSGDYESGYLMTESVTDSLDRCFSPGSTDMSLEY